MIQHIFPVRFSGSISTGLVFRVGWRNYTKFGEDKGQSSFRLCMDFFISKPEHLNVNCLGNRGQILASFQSL